MRKLVSYIMAGRMQATSAVVGFALSALFLLPLTLLVGKIGLALITLLTLFSGATLALVTLRFGATQGLFVLGMSTAIMMALNFLLVRGVEAALAYSLMQWVPLMLPALVLHATVSLRLALQAAIALGLISILGAHAAVPDISGFWSGMLDEYLRQAMLDPSVSSQMQEVDLQKIIATAARYMTGSLVASMLLSMAMMILVARWWQSMLYNPGGFRQEFLDLRLGLWPAILGIGLFLGSILVDTSMVAELAVISLVLFILQGVAIVHSACTKTSNPSLWLRTFYAVLVVAYLISGDANSIFMFSVVLAGICAIGLVDNFFDLRARMQVRK